MTDHQGHAGASGGGNDLLALFGGGGDRLCEEDKNMARDAGKRDLVMKMRRRCHRDGIDALGDQFVEASEGAAIDKLHRTRAVSRQRIDNADQADIGQTSEHPCVIAAHHARTDDADAKRAFWPCPHATNFIDPNNLPIAWRPGRSPSTSSHMWRMPSDVPGHNLIQKITPTNC